MSTDAATLRATQSVASIPRNDAGPVFREPWEAQAFALALALHERGVFTWKEWATTLGDEIKKAQTAGDPDTGETYYLHWLATLERLVAEKGLADPGLTRAHQRRLAARLQPHPARHADRITRGRLRQLGFPRSASAPDRPPAVRGSVPRPAPPRARYNRPRLAGQRHCASAA